MKFSMSWLSLLPPSVAEGLPKSEAVTRDLVATDVGAAALPDDGVIMVVGSNADAGVRSIVDDEGVPLAASLDVAILGFLVEDEKEVAALAAATSECNPN